MNKLRHIHFIIYAVFSIVFFRIIQIQFLFSPEFKKKEQRQVLRSSKEPLKRGSIYDRNFFIIADTRNKCTVEVYPYLLTEKSLAILKEAVGAEEFEEILKKRKKGIKYHRLREFNPDVFIDIFSRGNDGEFSGININITPLARLYTLKDEFSGILDNEFRGVTGVEYICDSLLRSGFMKVVYMKDGRGRIVRKRIIDEIKNGYDGVVLTVDWRLQKAIGEILDDVVKKTAPKRAVILVSDVNTGEILAARWYNTVEKFSFMPAAFTFEPGSVIKPFIMYAILKKGIKDEIDCENGSWKLTESIEIKDVHRLKLASLRDIMVYSSNIGFGKLSLKLEKRDIYEALKIFSIGDRLSDIPQAESGFLPHYSKWGKYDGVFISFGHGFSITPLQLIAGFSAIANGGRVMEPKLIKGYIKNGSFYEEDFYTIREISEKDILESIKNMLKAVVDEGTGKDAKCCIDVAGKTGTAQKIDPLTKKYTDKYTSSFAGFAPFYNPKIAVCVIIDEPHGEYYASKIAAPVFKEVIERALVILGEAI